MTAQESADRLVDKHGPDICSRGTDFELLEKMLIEAYNDGRDSI